MSRLFVGEGDRLKLAIVAGAEELYGYRTVRLKPGERRSSVDPEIVIYGKNGLGPYPK